MKIIHLLIIATLLLVSSVVSLSAQKIKNDRLSLGENIELVGLGEIWDENSTYTFIIPESLTYYRKGEIKVSPINPVISGIRAKYVHPYENPDYTVELICAGMSKTVKLNIGTPMSQEASGNVSFEFPTRLVISDKDKNIMKTYVIYDTNRVGLRFSPNMLHHYKLVPSQESSMANFFTSVSQMDHYYGKEGVVATSEKQERLFGAMEHSVLEQAVEIAKRLVCANYGVTTLKDEIFLFDVNAKQKTQFSELSQAIEKLAECIKIYIKSPQDKDNIKQMEEVTEILHRMYNTEGASKGLKEITCVDAIVGYLMLEKADKAYDLYFESKKNISFLSRVHGNLIKNFPILASRSYVLVDQPVVYCTTPLDINEYITWQRFEENYRERAEKHYQELLIEDEYMKNKYRDIVLRNGHMVDYEGNEYRGYFTIFFLERGARELNVDVHTPIRYTNSLPSTKGTILKYNSLRSIIVDDRKFDVIYKAVLDTVERSDGKDWDLVFLMGECMFENNDFAVYRDWAILDREEYIITSKYNKKDPNKIGVDTFGYYIGFRLSDILALELPALSCFPVDEQLLQQIKDGKFIQSKQGAINLVKAFVVY